jgi:TolB-like protein/tetratricopeptide (TPR) repeat protein
MSEGNFFSELKRRNVLRAAAFYAASAWLLVQVATQVFPFFHIAEWVVRWIVIAACIGFPFAMLFSWFYEWTPQGLQLESHIPPNESITGHTGRKLDRWIIAILGLAVVLLLANQFVRQHDESAPSGPAAKATPIPGKSIAVLPFADLSPKRDQESFSEGMAEEILNALARIKNLKVVGRASSFHYRGKDVALEKVGADLGVAHILEGSVRNQGEQLRITTTLLRTTDGVQEWSNTYDGRLADVFNLQESCAHDIAKQLDVFLGENGHQRLVDKTTDNAEAYALFIEAQTMVNARVGDNLPRAIAKLEKVTTLDPKFARAWAKLAIAHAVLAQYVKGSDWPTNLNVSESAAQRAIALDPDDAEAYIALSYVAFSRRRYVEMVAPAARALALEPENFTANYWTVNELAATGRSSEAEVIVDQILSRDPANALALYYKSMLRFLAGDNAAATSTAKRAEALGLPLGGITLAHISALQGDHDRGAEQLARALATMGTTFTSAQLETIYRGAYMDEAQRAAALHVIAARPDDQYVSSMLLRLGEPTRSFEDFEHSSTGLSDAYLNFLWYPDAWARKARQSPAFQGFAKRIGLVDYWKTNRWPDLCSPAPEKGPDAFTCR